MVRSKILQFVDKATDPRNTSSNDEFSKGLCLELNKYRNGEVMVLKLLVEKIRTFEEKISLQALNVIEYLTEHAGDHFKEEIGRNRFLNEFAKLLSPRYDADKCPKTIKDRISIILQHWYRTLPQYNKIVVAYKTLRSKGYLTADLSVEKKKAADEEVIGDLDSNKALNELLKSKTPQDLEKANLLIKSMVRKEENRSINIFHRKEITDEIYRKISEFRKLLAGYRETQSVNFDSLSNIRKELFDYHKNLNVVANEAVSERDPHVGELFALSDDLTSALNEYIACRELAQTLAMGEFIGAKVTVPGESHKDDDDLLDLGDFDSQKPVNPQPAQSNVTNDLLADIFSAPAISEIPKNNPSDFFSMAQVGATVNTIPQKSNFNSGQIPPVNQFDVFSNMQNIQFGNTVPVQQPQTSRFIPSSAGVFTQPNIGVQSQGGQNVYNPGMQQMQGGVFMQPAAQTSNVSSGAMLQNFGMYSHQNLSSNMQKGVDFSTETMLGTQNTSNIAPTQKNIEFIPATNSHDGRLARSTENISADKVATFDDLLVYSLAGIPESTKQVNLFENYSVDLSDLEVLNPKPVTGSSLGVFLASAKEKRAINSSVTPSSTVLPDIYILSLMNMLPCLVEGIIVTTESPMMNVKIIQNERTYLTAFSPVSPVSTTAATLLCEKSIQELSVCIAYTIDSVRKKDVVLLSLN